MFINSFDAGRKNLRNYSLVLEVHYSGPIYNPKEKSVRRFVKRPAELVSLSECFYRCFYILDGKRVVSFIEEGILIQPQKIVKSI